MSARRELKDFRFVLVRLYGRQMHLLFEQVLLADRPNVEHGHRVGNTAGNPCQLTVDIVEMCIRDRYWRSSGMENRSVTLSTAMETSAS